MRTAKVCSILVFCLSIGSGYAMNVIVAPLTGTATGNPTNTILNAIAQVNAGADATNSITLRSTEGPHILSNMEIWNCTGNKTYEFVAESGQPVVVLNWSSGRYMLTINALSATSTLTFTDIAFIPETGLSYGNNIADGINAANGTYTFTNCVFSSNDGSNGVASQEGALAYVQSPGGNNVGDDWIQFNTLGDATFDHCTLTGCADDAILIGGGTASDPGVLTLRNGTCIANVGGAGIQVFGGYCPVVIDGSGGRILIADVGKRTGAADTAIKTFWDVGCSVSITETDMINISNAIFYDFEGVPTIDITDSRLAFANYGNATPAGLFAVDDTSNDSPYGQTINLTRVTFHDCQGTAPNHGSIYYADGANDPVPTWNIIDSIFSGAGDVFDMANSTVSAATVNKSFTAVVQAGPDAVAAVGDMGVGSVSADPQYISYTYSIGRGHENGNFLLPSNLVDYGTAESDGGLLRGGATEGLAVEDWIVY